MININQYGCILATLITHFGIYLGKTNKDIPLIVKKIALYFCNSIEKSKQAN